MEALIVLILLIVAFSSPILKNNFLLYLIALELLVLSINLNFVFQGIYTDLAEGVFVCLLLLAAAAADTLIGLSLLIVFFGLGILGDIKLSALSRNPFRLMIATSILSMILKDIDGFYTAYMHSSMDWGNLSDEIPKKYPKSTEELEKKEVSIVPDNPRVEKSNVSNMPVTQPTEPFWNPLFKEELIKVIGMWLVTYCLNFFFEDVNYQNVISSTASWDNYEDMRVNSARNYPEERDSEGPNANCWDNYEDVRVNSARNYPEKIGPNPNSPDDVDEERFSRRKNRPMVRPVTIDQDETMVITQVVHAEQVVQNWHVSIAEQFHPKFPNYFVRVAMASLDGEITHTFLVPEFVAPKDFPNYEKYLTEYKYNGILLIDINEKLYKKLSDGQRMDWAIEWLHATEGVVLGLDYHNRT